MNISLADLTIFGNLIPPIVIAWGLITIFYSTFKSKFPELYFSTSDYTSLFLSVSPIRYVAFRLMPVLIIIAGILGIFKENIDQSNLYFLGLIIGSLYSFSTHGVALVKLAVSSKTIHTYFNKYFQVFVHIISILLILVTSLVGAAISKTEIASSLTPTFTGLVDNIWSSLITALLAVYLYKIYQNQQVSQDELFDQSFKKLSPKLIKFIEEYCAEKMADKNLVLAICIVENIQRPSWLRKVEGIKSLIFRRGSYGIMQVQSDKLLDDKQSVKKAIDDFFAYNPNLDILNIRHLTEKYNNDLRYIDLVEHAYHYLYPILG